MWVFRFGSLQWATHEVAKIIDIKKRKKNQDWKNFSLDGTLVCYVGFALDSANRPTFQGVLFGVLRVLVVILSR